MKSEHARPSPRLWHRHGATKAAPREIETALAGSTLRRERSTA